MMAAVGKYPPTTSDITVITEKRWANGIFDLYVQGEGWFLIVENKIDDSAWQEQRDRYQLYCDQARRRGMKAWLVYLRPSRARRFSITYGQIYEILDDLCPDARADLIIEHFKQHIFSDLKG
jgi:hypothetical protein